MKNIKESLFEWRKHYMVTLCGVLLFSLPTIAVFLPYGSGYEIYKWLIYGFIIAATFTFNILIARCENYEQTIEMMNDEIETLKDELNDLKKKNESV